MKISKTHQQFADELGNQRALEHPEEFLGPNWKNVLNFWFFLDTLNEDQWKSINDAFYSLSYYDHRLALNAADAEEVVGDAAWDAWSAAWDDTAGYAAGYATQELIGSHILQEQGKSLVVLPLFLNV